jgi:hypothetical protein
MIRSASCHAKPPTYDFLLETFNLNQEKPIQNSVQVWCDREQKKWKKFFVVPTTLDVNWAKIRRCPGSK